MFQLNRIVFAFTAALVFVSCALAQNPPTSTPNLTGSISAGLAATNGNTDTSNLNIAFTLVHDVKTANVIKANALYLRGNQNNAVIVDRSSVNLRDEYTISGRTFLFGQMDYFRDTFKDIRYLLGPTAGAGFKVLNGDKTTLLFDGGAGGIWEKNPALPVKKSGSLTAGQRFTSKVSSTVAVTQSIATIWKMNDFGDSLSNFAAGVTTSLNRRLEMKVEFLDSLKNKPSRPGIKKNDTAFVTALVFKF